MDHHVDLGVEHYHRYQRYVEVEYGSEYFEYKISVVLGLAFICGDHTHIVIHEIRPALVSVIS